MGLILYYLYLAVNKYRKSQFDNIGDNKWYNTDGEGGGYGGQARIPKINGGVPDNSCGVAEKKTR